MWCPTRPGTVVGAAPEAATGSAVATWLSALAVSPDGITLIVTVRAVPVVLFNVHAETVNTELAGTVYSVSPAEVVSSLFDIADLGDLVVIADTRPESLAEC